MVSGRGGAAWTPYSRGTAGRVRPRTSSRCCNWALQRARGWRLPRRRQWQQEMQPLCLRLVRLRAAVLLLLLVVIARAGWRDLRSMGCRQQLLQRRTRLALRRRLPCLQQLLPSQMLLQRPPPLRRRRRRRPRRWARMWRTSSRCTSRPSRPHPSPRRASRASPPACRRARARTRCACACAWAEIRALDCCPPPRSARAVPRPLRLRLQPLDPRWCAVHEPRGR